MNNVSAEINSVSHSDESRSRTFVTTFLVSWVAGIVVIAAGNWIVDPYGQYGSQVLPSLVQESRQEKLRILNDLEKPPDGLILGSSRTMKLEPMYLKDATGLDFFNFGVNHGRPEDCLAVLKYYQSIHNRLPKMVLMGIDVVALSDQVPSDARLSSTPTLYQFIRAELPWTEKMERYSQLWSFHQSRNSLKSIANWVSPKRNSCDDDLRVFESDGLIRYLSRESEIQKGEFQIEPMIEANRVELSSYFQKMDGLSEVRLRILREIFQLCDSQDCSLYVFTTTYHPELKRSLESLANFDRLENEAKEILDQASIDHHFVFRNLSDIESYSGDEREFVDGIHPLEANTRRMIDTLLIRSGESTYALQ